MGFGGVGFDVRAAIMYIKYTDIGIMEMHIVRVRSSVIFLIEFRKFFR